MGVVMNFYSDSDIDMKKEFNEYEEKLKTYNK